MHRPAAALALGALLACGCEPKPETVRAWAETADGPRKIAALIPDGTRSVPLRVLAATTLVNLGEVFALADAMRATAEADRRAILVALLPGLLGALAGDDVAAGGRAKDALFYVGGHLPDAERQKAGAAVIEWAGADFSGRFAEGRATLAQVLPEMGTATVPRLIALLRDGEAIPEIAKVLSSYESQAVHDQAAAALVEVIERHGEKTPPEAWDALNLFRSAALTPLLLKQLNDKRVPAERKDAWFEHLPKCGGPEAGPGLGRLLKDHEMRWIAAQALLDLEGVEGIRRVLAELPATDAAYEPGGLYDPVRFFCKQRVEALKVSRATIQATLLPGLDPARPLAAATAMACLEEHGATEAVAALKPLAKSRTALPGWKGRATLGDLAAQAIAAIRARGE